MEKKISREEAERLLTAIFKENKSDPVTWGKCGFINVTKLDFKEGACAEEIPMRVNVDSIDYYFPNAHKVTKTEYGTVMKLRSAPSFLVKEDYDDVEQAIFGATQETNINLGVISDVLGDILTCLDNLNATIENNK